MKLNNVILIALFALFAVSNVASAFAVQANVNQVDVVAGRTSATVPIWFTNTADSTQDYAVSFNAGLLQARANPATGSISAGSTQAVLVTFTTPVCAKGTFYPMVGVELENGDYDIRTIPVNVVPGVDCDSFIEGQPSGTVPFYEETSGAPFSRIAQSQNFEPTTYSVRIDSKDGVSKLADGQLARVAIEAVNLGSSGDFQFALVANPAMHAFVTQSSAVLSTSQAAAFSLDVAPRGLTGRQWVTLQVLRNGQVVSEKQIYFDVANFYEATVAIPSKFDLTTCSTGQVSGTIYNTGSARDTFVVEALGQLQTVQVPARSQAGFAVEFNSTNLPLGESNVVVTATGAYTKGSATSKLSVMPCGPINATDSVKYEVAISNTRNSTIEGASATVVGLPTGWTIVSETPVDIPAGQNHTFAIVVNPTGEWTQEVKPVVIVTDKSGTVLLSKPMQPIAPKSGALTGLFTAFNGNIGGIAILVLLALVVAIMTARAQLDRATAKTYLERI